MLSKIILIITVLIPLLTPCSSSATLVYDDPDSAIVAGEETVVAIEDDFDADQPASGYLLGVKNPTDPRIKKFMDFLYEIDYVKWLYRIFLGIVIFIGYLILGMIIIAASGKR